MIEISDVTKIFKNKEGAGGPRLCGGQEAELEGTIRVFTPEIRKQTKARPAILYCRLRAVARMK